MFEMMGMGGPRDCADVLREAVMRGKLNRLDPNVVREFIATYMVPLKDTIQRALLEDPESVNALEGRCAPIDASYLKDLSDEALADTDRALDVLAHALLASNNEESSYVAWQSARAKVISFFMAARGKLRSLAKEFVEREKQDSAESVWFWNFIEIGAITRSGNTFTLKSLHEASQVARDYLRRRLGGPRGPVGGETSVTIE